VGRGLLRLRHQVRGLAMTRMAGLLSKYQALSRGLIACLRLLQSLPPVCKLRLHAHLPAQWLRSTPGRMVSLLF